MTNRLIHWLRRMNFRLNTSPFTVILLILFLGFAPEWYAYARKIFYINQDSKPLQGVLVQKESMHNGLQRMTYAYEYEGKYYLGQKAAEWTPNVGDSIIVRISKSKPEISEVY